MVTPVLFLSAGSYPKMYGFRITTDKQDAIISKIVKIKWCKCKRDIWHDTVVVLFHFIKWLKLADREKKVTTNIQQEKRMIKNHTTQLLNISSIIHCNKVFLIESHSVFFLFFLTRSRSLVTWEASKYMLYVARNNLKVRLREEVHVVVIYM